jgi:hypothetical protein
MLAQLKLPGGLRAPGVLTDKRFTRKKDRFLSR